MKPSIRQKLDLLVDRLDEIDRMLSAPSTANDMDQFRKLSRERSEIEPVIVQFNAFRQAENDLAEAEAMLQDEILKALEGLAGQVMLKLSLPTVPDFYQPLVRHPKVLKVVALSGGHSRDAANQILAQNHGIIASFSRALSEGLSAKQTEAEFDKVLKNAVDSIHAASIT